MELRRLEKAHVPLVASWLAAEENYRWLDFGRGRQVIAPATLTVMAQQPFHLLLTFTADTGEEPEPIGVLGLSEISETFRYASLWYVLGNKDYAGQGYTTRAVKAALGMAFHELDLHSVEAWTVQENRGSIAVLRKSGFKEAGRRRECHEVNGKLRDRLYFDILRPEYQNAYE